MVTYVRNLNGTWLEPPPYSEKSLYYIRSFVKTDVHEQSLWIICIVTMWVRVFYLLRYNEYVGKFMGIVERIIPELAVFFVFFIIELGFFSVMAEVCFRDLPSFSTTSKAFKTFFYASFGEFSFDEVSQARYGEYFGYAFMILFLVCTIGIIFNLFIAIIVVLWEERSASKNVY